MRANAFLVLIWLTVGIVGYVRLPELLQDYTRNWQTWQLEMMATSAALVIGVLAALACLITMAVYGRKP